MGQPIFMGVLFIYHSMHAGLANDQRNAKLILPPQIFCIDVITTLEDIFVYSLIINYDYKLQSNVRGNVNREASLMYICQVCTKCIIFVLKIMQSPVEKCFCLKL